MVVFCSWHYYEILRDADPGYICMLIQHLWRIVAENGLLRREKVPAEYLVRFSMKPCVLFGASWNPCQLDVLHGDGFGVALCRGRAVDGRGRMTLVD